MIWPFKKKQKVKKTNWVVENRRIANAQIADLVAFRGIGEMFRYLGRECVVTGHFELYVDYIGPYGLPDVGIAARLKADYVDNEGVIRNISFMHSELPTLKAQNAEAPA